MKAIFHNLCFKLIAIVLAVSNLFGASTAWFQADSSGWKTNYTYVFVHGLSGWGSYDSTYKLMPYWGMFGGDLMKYLNDKGFHAVCASVSPRGSAWDRACELYAELTGTRVDYGKAHSERCGHARFGEDYTGRALVKAFSERDKISLLGHSFGGATVRLFASVMEQGSAEERAATPAEELSDYFKGGKGSWIHSLTALAAPHNGTTAYSDEDASEQLAEAEKEIPPLEKKLQEIMSRTNSQKTGDRIEEDYADYDMYIDHALTLNKTILTLPETYYFSIPCSCSEQQPDGTWSPINSKMELMFRSSSRLIGQYTGVTRGGYVIDESWLENDGLVNTISAKAPFGAPQKDFDPASVQPGVWNILPVYQGDHMSLQGGLFKTNDIKELYLEHLSMINAL
jgi:triacylglycerol lipase